jgi:hypothetical protein
MDIVNLLNTPQGSLFDAIKNYQEDQESKSSALFSHSANSDRVSFSQEAMQLAAKSESNGQEKSEGEPAGGGGTFLSGGSSAESASKVQELQSKLQALQSRLAAALQQGNEAQAAAIQGQISAVMAQIAALQAEA